MHGKCVESMKRGGKGGFWVYVKHVESLKGWGKVASPLLSSTCYTLRLPRINKHQHLLNMCYNATTVLTSDFTQTF